MRLFKCRAPSTKARLGGRVVRGSGLPCGCASADLGMAEKLGMF